jgi:hypothetical protein
MVIEFALKHGSEQSLDRSLLMISAVSKDPALPEI